MHICINFDHNARVASDASQAIRISRKLHPSWYGRVNARNSNGHNASPEYVGIDSWNVAVPSDSFPQYTIDEV